MSSAKKPKSDTRARAWMVTLFEKSDALRLNEAADVVVLVIGEEVAPTTGRVHYQSYVRFNQPKRFSWWKNQFPQAHVDARRGTEEEAVVYCRKDGNMVVDRGYIPGTDLQDGETEERQVVRKILKGVPKGRIIHDHWWLWYTKGSKLRPFYDDVHGLMDAGLYDQPEDI